MKQFLAKITRHTLLLSIMALGLTFYSCDSESEDPDPDPGVDAPRITFLNTNFDTNTGGDTKTGPVGDSITFSVRVDAAGVFNNLKIDASVGTVDVFDTIYSKAPGATDVTFQTPVFSWEFTQEFAGSIVTFAFEAVDDLNQITRDTLFAQVLAEDAGIFSAVLLSAPTEDKTSQTFFATTTGETWSQQEVEGAGSNSPLIDFGYYYGQMDEASIASPSGYPETILDLSLWDKLNDTRFVKTTISVDNFNLITKFDGELIQQLIDIDESGAIDQAAISNLGVNDVLAFTTDATKDGGTKTGLIKVISITEGEDVDGKIEIEVKVEK